MAVSGVLGFLGHFVRNTITLFTVVHSSEKWGWASRVQGLVGTTEMSPLVAGVSVARE